MFTWHTTLGLAYQFSPHPHKNIVFEQSINLQPSTSITCLHLTISLIVQQQRCQSWMLPMTMRRLSKKADVFAMISILLPSPIPQSDINGRVRGGHRKRPTSLQWPQFFCPPRAPHPISTDGCSLPCRLQATATKRRASHSGYSRGVRDKHQQLGICWSKILHSQEAWKRRLL